MSDERDQLDRQLVDRLRAHESRVPHEAVPDLRGGNRTRWRLIAAGSTVVVAGLLAILTLPQLLRPTAFEPSPSPSTSAAPTEPLSRAASFGSDGSLERVSDITAWPGGFVAVGTYYEAERMPNSGPIPPHEGRIWTSPDGQQWTDTTPAGTFEDRELRYVVAAPDGSLITLGESWNEDLSRVTNVAWRSTDGRSWESAELAGLPAHDHTLALDAGPLGMVAALDGASLWHSDDGLSWRMTQSGPGYYDYPPRVLDVAAGPEGFVALLATHLLSGAQLPYVVTSSDGVSWVEGEAPRNAVRLGTLGPDWVIASNAVDPDSPPDKAVIWSSADGLDWERRDAFQMGLAGASETACPETASVLLAAAGRILLSTALQYPCSEGGFVIYGRVWSALAEGMDRWAPLTLPQESSVVGAAFGEGVTILAVNLGSESTRAQFWTLHDP
jgi:hypothetical protein